MLIIRSVKLSVFLGLHSMKSWLLYRKIFKICKIIMRGKYNLTNNGDICARARQGSGSGGTRSVLGVVGDNG